jgi:anti-sigma factor RsiW
VSAVDRSVTQALAYVDECLEANERAEFEHRLAKDSDLAARVEQWHGQNVAIRRVFEDTWRNRQSRNKAEDPHERLEAAASAPVALLQIDQRQTRPFKTHRSSLTHKAAERESHAPSLTRLLGRSLAIVVVGLAAWALSVVPAPVDRASFLTASAFSAYRTFATGRPVEMATAEPAALERWLQNQIDAVIAIPNFAPAGFTLIGGRVIAGAQGPAAFALYRNASGQRLGLISERGDSAPNASTLIQSSGDLRALAVPGFRGADGVIVADVDEETLKAIAHLVAHDTPGD